MSGVDDKLDDDLGGEELDDLDDLDDEDDWDDDEFDEDDDEDLTDGVTNDQDDADDEPRPPAILCPTCQRTKKRGVLFERTYDQEEPFWECWKCGSRFKEVKVRSVTFAGLRYEVETKREQRSLEFLDRHWRERMKGVCYAALALTGMMVFALLGGGREEGEEAMSWQDAMIASCILTHFVLVTSALIGLRHLYREERKAKGKPAGGY